MQEMQETLKAGQQESTIVALRSTRTQSINGAKMVPVGGRSGAFLLSFSVRIGRFRGTGPQEVRELEGAAHDGVGASGPWRLPLDNFISCV